MKKSKRNKMSLYQSNSPPPPYYESPNEEPHTPVSSNSYVSTPVMIHMPVYYGQAQEPSTPQHPPTPHYPPATQHFPASQFSPAPQHLPVSQYSPAPQHLPASQYSPAPQHLPASQYPPASQHLPASQYPPASQHSPASQYSPALQHLPASQYPPAPQYPPASQYPPAQQQGSPLQQTPAQPTYVTNYIYQQPTPSVTGGTIEWAPATVQTAGEFKHRALVAARNALGFSFWVIRAHHCGDLVPGKWSTKRKIAFIPHGGREIPVNSFEILLAEEHRVCWVPSSNGQIPTGAIVAGSTQDGEPLYIGRAKHNLFIINGKVQPSKKCCYVSHLGFEHAYKSYHVLCQK